MAAQIRIGTSGWSYDGWNGIVYPEKTASADRLGHYAKLFDTVELNASYYHWPKDSVFAGWRERLQAGFAMTVKAPRGLTHESRLAQPAEWIERLRSGMAELGEPDFNGGKRGVLLLQLPPTLEFDLDLLRGFIKQVTSWQRTAVEFRHQSWETEAVFDLLEELNAAYVVMSGARLPCTLRATSKQFVYVRFHGPDNRRMYAGSYSDDDMRWWADRIREWHGQARDVYAYFNNDASGNAVRNAQTLRQFCNV